jgi:hypothetical protein
MLDTKSASSNGWDNDLDFSEAGPFNSSKNPSPQKGTRPKSPQKPASQQQSKELDNWEDW